MLDSRGFCGLVYSARFLGSFGFLLRKRDSESSGMVDGGGLLLDSLSGKDIREACGVRRDILRRGRGPCMNDRGGGSEELVEGSEEL